MRFIDRRYSTSFDYIFLLIFIVLCIPKRSSLESLFEPILFTIIDLLSLYIQRAPFGVQGQLLAPRCRIVYCLLIFLYNSGNPIQWTPFNHTRATSIGSAGERSRDPTNQRNNIKPLFPHCSFEGSLNSKRSLTTTRPRPCGLYFLLMFRAMCPTSLVVQFHYQLNQNCLSQFCFFFFFFAYRSLV